MSQLFICAPHSFIHTLNNMASFMYVDVLADKKPNISV